MNEKLAVGRIVTTHGLRGEVKVKSFSGETEHFRGITEIEIRGKTGVFTKRIESMKFTGKGVILKIEGFDTVTEAQKITGGTLWADRMYCAPLGDNEYYTADLCGCRVTCRGKQYGTVVHVVAGIQADLLEVEGGDGTYRYLPCMDVFIAKLDLEEMNIELRDDWIMQ